MKPSVAFALALTACPGALTPTGTVGGNLIVLGAPIPGGGGCWRDDGWTVLLLQDPDYRWARVRFDDAGMAAVAPHKGYRLSADGNAGFLGIGSQPCATITGDTVSFDCVGPAQDLYWVDEGPASEAVDVSISLRGVLGFSGCAAARPW